MLAPRSNYPLRGAVTWKSIVGTNVAADALSNLASPGVVGGALSSWARTMAKAPASSKERSYAYAMKSSMWLIDPRPDLPTIVRMVEEGFELSEASHAPVMLELRIRACHVTGEFKTKANRHAAFSGNNRIAARALPIQQAGASAGHLSQERLKVEERLPAAQAFIRERELNEVIAGDLDDVGIIVMGGLTTACCVALLPARPRRPVRRLAAVPILVLNVVYPLVPEEVRRLLRRQARRARRRGRLARPTSRTRSTSSCAAPNLQTRVLGKGCLPETGEYISEVADQGASPRSWTRRAPRINADPIVARAKSMLAPKAGANRGGRRHPAAAAEFLHRCPERPVFSRLKLMQRELAPTSYQR